jgi:hypothetical protein
LLKRSRGKENAVKGFVEKHQAKITGTISCFDRILFKGHLPLGWAEAMEHFIAAQGLRIKDFKRFVQTHSGRLRAHAANMARKTGRPFPPLSGSVRQEDLARGIANSDGITEGLVCILTAVEPCQSFKIAYGEK